MKFLILLASIVSADACVVLVNPFGSFGGGVAYFFSERFDGAGYQNVWVESGSGTMNEDYATAPAPLEGTQSLRIAGTAQAPIAASPAFSSDQDELWVFFRIHLVSLPSASRAIFVIRNTAVAAIGSLTLETDGSITAKNGTVADATDTVTPMSIGTTYNVWLHWVKGTGANGITQIGFSTTGTEVTSGNEFTNTAVGDSTTDAHDLRFGFSSNTTAEFIVDQVLVSNTGTIGNDPL